MCLILFVDRVNFITSVESEQIPIQYMSATDEFLREPGSYFFGAFLMVHRTVLKVIESNGKVMGNI